MKNSLEGFKGRSGQKKESAHMKQEQIKLPKLRNRKKRNCKKWTKATESVRYYKKKEPTYACGNAKRRKAAKRLFEEMIKNFSDLIKDMNIHTS